MRNHIHPLLFNHTAHKGPYAFMRGKNPHCGWFDLHLCFQRPEQPSFLHDWSALNIPRGWFNSPIFLQCLIIDFLSLQTDNDDIPKRRWNVQHACTKNWIIHNISTFKLSRGVEFTFSSRWSLMRILDELFSVLKQAGFIFCHFFCAFFGLCSTHWQCHRRSWIFTATCRFFQIWRECHF